MKTKSTKSDQFYKKNASLFLFGSIFCVSNISNAAIDGRVLPQGRSRFSFNYATTDGITQNFNNDGDKQSLTKDYNVDLSSANLKTYHSSLAQLIQWLNSSGLHYNINNRNDSSHGITADSSKPLLGDALSAGFLSVSAEAKRSQYSLSYQRGITDRFTAGMMIPYIQNDIKIAHGFSGPNTAQDIYEGYYSQQSNTLQEITDALNMLRNPDSSIQKVLEARGYDRVEDTHESGFGDLVFGGRYKFLDTERFDNQWVGSVQSGITAPLGRLKSTHKVTASDFGQGCWDIGTGTILNYKPIAPITLSNTFNYTYRLPGKRTLRVREFVGDSVPEAKSDEEIDMALGDKYWTALGTRASVLGGPLVGLSLDVDYEWYWKRPDRYQGNRPKDYTYLSENTQVYKETLTLGISYNTITRFMNHQFAAPIEVTLTYNRPMSGKNAAVASFGTAELALFF